MSARDVPFQSNNVHLVRERFGVRTAKINRVENNFKRSPDSTYSVQVAAAALGITTQLYSIGCVEDIYRAPR